MKKIHAIIYLIFILLTINTSSVISADYYWVGGSGNWSDYANHWATTSGGNTFHTQVPQSVDNVFFDANSFTAPGQVVTIDKTIIHCNDMIWTGVMNMPTMAGSSSNSLMIYGLLTFVPGMNIIFSGTVNFESTTPGKTITSASQSFKGYVNFNGIGGGWTLTDSLTTAKYLTLNNGTLDVSNQTVNAVTFNSNGNGTRSLLMVSSTWRLSHNWSVSGSGMTINAVPSTIFFTGGGSMDGGGFNYHNVRYMSSGTGQVTDNNNTFNDVYFEGGGNIIGDNNTFHNVYFTKKAEIWSKSTFNTFHDVYFGGDATIYNYPSNGVNIFHDVVMSKNGFIKGSNIYNSLTLTAGYTYTLTSGVTQTILASFIANGTCSTPITINSSIVGSQSTIAQSSGSLTASHLNMKDIKATGGASFTANNSIDLGNNTGWTINSPASRNLYWIGGIGNWSDGNHWSLTSGGSPSGCSPNPLDNVFFDANSFTATNQKVTIDPLIASCNNMNWTGVTNTPTLAGQSGPLKIYGSLVFAANMNITLLEAVNFEATTVGKTIISAGQSFRGHVNFNGIGGGWTLVDSLTTTKNIMLNNGTLDVSNQTVNTVTFNSNSNGTRSLLMVSSTWRLSGNWSVSGSGMTINAVPSTILFTGGGSMDGGGFNYHNVRYLSSTGQVTDNNNTFNDVYFEGNGNIAGNSNTFHDVYFTKKASIWSKNTFHDVYIGDDAAIDDANLFHDIIMSKNGTIKGNNTYNKLTLTAGYTYTLTSGVTQTIITSLIAGGNCGAPIAINSNSVGSQSTISQVSGSVTVSFINMKDINATGGAVFTANNTIDLGNNTGWTINSPASKNLYWIGGTGNWSDGSHWSLMSGGSPSGCSPNPLDNVFFDVNSFSASGQSVTIDPLIASCNDMTWTGVTNTPTLAGTSAGSSNKMLMIYGSLVFVPGMKVTFLGTVNFEATTVGKIITSANQSFKGFVNFNGIGGGWTLTDSLTTAKYLTLNNGTLDVSNQTVNTVTFNSHGDGTRSLQMVSSTWRLSNNWSVSGSGMTINAVLSSIFFTGGVTCSMEGGGFNYHNVRYMSSTGQVTDNNNTFNDVYFEGGGNITGDGNIFHDVYFTKKAEIWSKSTFNTFHDVYFGGDATIYNYPSNGVNLFHDVIMSKNGTIKGNNTYNSLTLSAGYIYTFTSGTTQTIISGLNATGTGSFPIRIQSSVPGSPFTFHKVSGTVCIDYVRLSDNTATGGAVFNAGVNSDNISGNTGWTFLGSGSIPAVAISSSYSGVICIGTNVQFTATSTNGGVTPSYQWKVNGVNTGSNDSIFSSTTLTDNDIVTCEMTPGISCFTGLPAVSNPITINAGNSAQAGTITALRDTICAGTPATLTITGSTAGVQWQSSDSQGNNFTAIGGATSITYLPVPPQTTYYRVVAGSGDCADTSAAFKLVVLPSPVAAFSSTVNGLQVNFIDESTGATGYNWNFGDGSISAETNPAYSYSQKDIYHVCLTVYNGSNCSFTFCRDIDLLTGVTALSKNDNFIIYPNPFSNIIFISNESSKQIESIELIDVLGRIIKTQDTRYKTQDFLNVSDLAQGVYYLKIKTNEGNYIQPIVKQ